ncbi:outer membrane lipoprotein-sorting protein [Clostridium sp. MSJ-11]|uniref:Outer membrane lipoprotein-sorting protein n=1 Tax=Clostridium mobile TaxID=2841512 RepID=A0ABS6EH94_9CLOT|nr:outer membrane lipoprotein-sorting protein [Clostridium mobile]MBU5484577.1 outer membrane lipoprotein-sorting protein [Clostridium mobile]
MIKKRIVSIIMGGLLSVTALSGCGTQKSILPETIVAHAMESEDNVKSYYGEARIRLYDKDNKIVEDSIMKEWHDTSKGKMKVRTESYSNEGELETVTTNDGNNVVSYMIKDKKALTMKSLSESDMPIRTQREQTKIFLENIKKSHAISTVGEEKINGMDTYHIKAVPKEKNTIFSEQDIWIDKENWFTIKIISHDSESKIECEYTKIDFSPKIDDKIFTQEIPKDVKIENINESGPKTKTMTLKEVRDFLGKPFAYFSESSSYKIKDIKLQQYGSEAVDDEIIMEYQKDNKPYFSISLRKGKKIDSDASEIPGTEEITIRGQKGNMFKDNISIIFWSEGDVRYSIIPYENIEKVEDFIKELDKMEMFN